MLEAVEANPYVSLPARISYRDNGGATLDMTVQVSDPQPATETSLRDDFARARIPIRNFTMVRDIATTGEPPYPLRGVITDAPTADAAVAPIADTPRERTDAAWTCL
jgi:hypothetical protein